LTSQGSTLAPIFSGGGSVSSFNTRAGAVVANTTDVPLLGYITGLTLSTAGGSATFGIAIGQTTSTDSTTEMALGSAYTKTTGAWVVGSGNGGLDTGAIANTTWYHVFLIERTDTGVVDVLISLSPSAPTMPTNYTKKRRIGAMLTNGSAQWVAFSQLGFEFLWSVPVANLTGGAVATTGPSTFTLTVPTGIQVNALINGLFVYDGANSDQGLITSFDQAATTATSNIFTGITGSAAQFGAFSKTIRTNTSGQIRVQVNHTGTGLNLITGGWVDAL